MWVFILHHIWKFVPSSFDIIMFILKVADLTHFLRANDSRLQFIWSSEISGFRHLYLATANSNHTLTRARAGSFISECCIHYPLVTQQQLTDGDWEVDGKEVGIMHFPLFTWLLFHWVINIFSLFYHFYLDLGGWESATYLLHGQQRYTFRATSVSVWTCCCCYWS